MSNQEIHHGSHFKKILTKGTWYFFSSIFVKAINLFLLPIVTRYLSPSEYGVLSTLDSISQLLPVFISLALDEAYVRFYFNHNKSYDELKKYISTYFWIILGWGIFVFIISLIIGKISITKILDVPFYPFIPLTMLGPLLLQLSVLGNAYLRQQLKAEFLSLIEIILHVVYMFFYIYLLVIAKLGMQAKIYGYFISNVLSFVIFGIVIFKNKLISFNFNKRIFTEGLKYSIPLLPNQMSEWIKGLSSRIILTVLKTTADTGIYSIGYQLGITLRMISMAVFKVYTPIMYSMLVNKKEEGVKKVEDFIPFYFFIMFWFAFCLGFFSKEFIVLLTDSKYHTAYVVVPIVAYAYFFGAIYKPFLNIISYHKKTWIISGGAIFQAAANIIFNIIFIPRFGKMAAAWTTFSSFFIYMIWIFLWSQYFEKLKINWNKIIITLGIGFITVILYILLLKIFLLSFWLILLLKIFLVITALFLSYIFKLIDIDYLKLKK